MSAGGLDPTPPDPGAAPLDVAAIRARAADYPDIRELLHGQHPRVREGVPRVVTVDVPNLCDALEREREAAEYWRDLARARGAALDRLVGSDRDDMDECGAIADLRSIGIDPEAP